MLLLSVLGLADAAWPPEAKPGEPVQVYLAGHPQAAHPLMPAEGGAQALWPVGVWTGSTWESPPPVVWSAGVFEPADSAGDWCVKFREYPVVAGSWRGTLKSVGDCTAYVSGLAVGEDFGTKSLGLATWPKVAEHPPGVSAVTDAAGLASAAQAACGDQLPEELAAVGPGLVVLSAGRCRAVLEERSGTWTGTRLEAGSYAGALQLPGMTAPHLVFFQGWLGNGDVQSAAVFAQEGEQWVRVHEFSWGNP